MIDPRSLRRAIAGPMTLAVVAAGLFFVVGGGWAALAPLRSAVIAPGVVTAELGRRTIQHLEGGILRTVAVREGQHVEAGQVLVELDDVAARSRLTALTARLRALAATEARLEAERADAPDIAFTHASLRDRDDPAVAALLAAERRHLRALREDRANREAILGQRLAQIEKQIDGYEAKRAALSRQNALVEDEVTAVRALVAEGLSVKPRQLALEREQARLLGEVGDLTARIALAEEAMGQTRLEIMTLRLDRLPRIDDRLAEVRSERIAAEEALTEAADTLRRTVVTAPVDGAVLALRFTTAGGVVGPGEALLDLVPTGESLVIDARVSPRDIDSVGLGQSVAVSFPALPSRHQMRLEGEVTRVAADALSDRSGGPSYFGVQVTVAPQALAAVLPEEALHPGLPAEVSIATGQRTVLGVVLDPLTRTLERGLRED